MPARAISFVTADPAWSADELRKARAGVHTSIAYGGIILATCAGGVAVAESLGTLMLAALIGAVAMFVNPVVVRLSGRPLIAGRMLAFEVLAGITLTAVANGGMTEHGLEATTLPWLLVVPVLAATLVGSAFACLSAVLCVAQVLVMWRLHQLGVQFPATHAGEAALSSVWSTLSAIAFLLALSVISERMRALANSQRDAIEIELHAAQKLEAVGRLAAGVAHEINTPVQFVSDSIHFVADAMEDLGRLHAELKALVDPARAAEVEEAEARADHAYLKQEIPGALKRSLEGVERVGAIVKAMKAFARADLSTRTPVDLNSAVADTLTIAKSEYKLVADLITEFGALPPVTCHAGQINQVVLSLVCNAAQAIADAVKGTERRGRIVVRTSCEGSDAVIAITDTGTGIPAEVRGRIFEPYFTTREVGRGTGQALSISRTFVTQHRGRLTFESEVGVGTTFFVRLPLAA